MTITLNGTTGVTTTGLTSNGIDDNANSTAITIDSSGNVLVGKTSSSSSVAGFMVEPDGDTYITAEGVEGRVLYLNRLSSDGDIIQFYKDGSTVGSIGVASSDNLYIGATTANHAGVYFGTNIVYPMTAGSISDGAVDLGQSTSRWDDIYATNGTIQTSDSNEKQDVAALTATEMLVAARISTGFKTFRWIDSVSDKGDNARTHTGVIAQDVQAAFIAEGLDAGDYALFTSATWWETQTDVPAVEADEDNDIEAADAYTRTDTFDTLDEAPDGATERTRMGIRYPELLAFVGSYNEQRFASIETRLAALEESP